MIAPSSDAKSGAVICARCLTIEWPYLITTLTGVKWLGEYGRGIETTLYRNVFVSARHFRCDETNLKSVDAGGFERMVPNDDEPKRAVTVTGYLVTYVYEGPVTWPHKRRSADTPTEGDSRMYERLEFINGATRPVTILYEGDSFRIMKPEE